MKRILWLCLFVILGLGVLLAATDDAADHPQYIGKNRLLPPQNYREWIFVSSGLGMNYSAMAMGDDQFTNVFVPQWAYQAFIKSGKWPDKTMFVVEERKAQSKGSINKHGNFQTD